MSTFKPLAFGIRADLFTHLAAMERAGLPAQKAYALLRLPHPGQGRVEAMRKLLARGTRPALAGEKSGLFTRLEANLLDAAFAAGSPAATYRRLSDSYTLKAKQIATMKSQMALPVMVFVAALFIAPLPALAAGKLSAGGYVLQALRPLIGLAGLALLATRLPGWFERGAATPTRQVIERVLCKIPVFGAMHQRRNCRNFFESLGLLLEAGVPMFDALPKALETIQNHVIRQEFAAILPGMQDGATLADALERVALLRGSPVIAFARTGEGSGTLPEMLFRHADLESGSIALFQQQVADWLPRLFYAAIAGWMAYGILSGQGVGPVLPADLR